MNKIIGNLGVTFCPSILTQVKRLIQQIKIKSCRRIFDNIKTNEIQAQVQLDVKELPPWENFTNR
jgi:hypothetical protein